MNAHSALPEVQLKVLLVFKELSSMKMTYHDQNYLFKMKNKDSLFKKS